MDCLNSSFVWGVIELHCSSSEIRNFTFFLVMGIAIGAFLALKVFV